MRILVSNDDGYLSPGLYMLADIAEEFGDVMISSTEYPRSASGREITFSRPLRYLTKTYENRTIRVTDGTPIDALHLAIEVAGFRPDLVLSGVNVGDNLSLQHIFYSGTLAVAIEAALMGIESIAFSADVRSFKDFENESIGGLIRSVAKGTIKYVISNGLPRGVDLISVNIPVEFNRCVRLVKASRIRWRAAYKEGKDPRGRRYYWLYGVRGETEHETDVKAFEEGCVTITPLNIDLNVSTDSFQDLSAIEETIKQLLPQDYRASVKRNCY